MPSIQDFTTRVSDNVEQVIIGKREPIELLMVALLCEGHVLIEDVPGTGKTMLARAVPDAPCTVPSRLSMPLMDSLRLSIQAPDAVSSRPNQRICLTEATDCTFAAGRSHRQPMSLRSRSYSEALPACVNR